MYQSLQAGRAAAATLVVVYHVVSCVSSDKYFNLPWVTPPYAWGKLAVEYFYVLSGFILFMVHQQDLFRPQHFLPYILKRIIRIYPTYILIFLGVLVPALLIPSLRSSVPTDPIILASRLVLVPQWLQTRPSDGSPFNVIGVSSSLEYEVFFYALFALLFLGRPVAVLLVAALLAAFIARMAGAPLPDVVLSIAGENTITFLLGIAAAGIHRSGFRMPYPGWISLTCGFLLFTLHADWFRPFWPNIPLRALGTGMCSAGLILGLLSAEERGLPVGQHPWFQRLGDTSYALYLIHFPLVSFMTKVAMAVGMTRLGLLGIGLTILVEIVAAIAVSIAFHCWVEKPLLAFLRRKTHSLTKPNEPAHTHPTGAG
jgi:exopolysaccharide production protein ExoZ